MVVDQITNNNKSHAGRSYSPNIFDRIKLRKRGQVNVQNPDTKQVTRCEKSQISRKSFDFPSKKCDIPITKIDMSKHLKNKKLQVKLKNCHGKPNSISDKKVQNKIESLKSLKPNPKTIKDFQNNERVLADFNNGHSDDMFEYANAANYVSQMNLLENSFSDMGSSQSTAPNTPVTDFISHFEGWSVQTPINLRIEEEEKNPSLGQFNHCAFLRKAIKQKKKPKKLFRTLPVASAQSSSTSFSSCLSQIQPALQKNNSSSQSDTEDEMEHYFEDLEGQT